MMTDSEIEQALLQMADLTSHDDMKWVASDDGQLIESDDLVGFAVSLRLVGDGIRFTILEDGREVASVASDDGRTLAQRSRLQGSAYTLFQIARPAAESGAASRLQAAIQKKRT
jgi:hypothetical protein